MNLVSFGFLAFVLLAVAVYYALPERFRPCWLLAASLGFYLYVNVKYVIYLAFSILSSYICALAIQRRDKGRKALLALCLLANLAILAAVKYLPYSFSLIGKLLGIELPAPRLLVPLGISFYTLQALSYLLDVYRGKTEAQPSLWRYSLFMSFFPIIMQGPISRYDQLSPQLFTAHSFDYKKFCFGAQLMLWGYFKKMVIADRAAILVNQVFNNYGEYSGLPVFLAMLLYTLRLYADFSGCVDISRGIAGMLGIELAHNFRHPFFAVSIQDFWRRWHISLSSWLRDYLYIPLGGSHRGMARRQFNTLTVFAVSGLWHGVGLNYLFWGLLHGLYLVLGSLTRGIRDRGRLRLGLTDSTFLMLFRRLVTFLLVAFAFLFFGAPGLRSGFHMALSMFTGFSFSQFRDGCLLSLGMDAAEFIVLALALLVLLLVSVLQERGSVRELIARQKLPLRWAVYLLGLFSVLIFGIYGPGYNSAQFIYMNF